MPPPPRRALIVIDVQNEYVTGRLRIEYPPLTVSLANIGLAMDAAQAVGVPVVVVQNRAPAGAPLFAHGSDGWQLHPAVASRSHSHRVEKALPSAFAHTDLGQWLTHHEVDTLTIAGYMTHNCNAATAFEAMHRGMTVEFLADATGAVSYKNDAGTASAEDIHHIFSVVFHSRFAAVATTQAWIEAARAERVLPRGSIFESHRLAMSAQSSQ